MNPTKAIFSDPTQRRWRHIRRFLFYISAVGTMFFLILIVSIILNPIVHRLQIEFPHKRTLKVSARHKRRFFAANTPSKRGGYGHRRSPVADLLHPGAEPPKAKLSAFYVNGAAASYASLLSHAAKIQTLYPQWLFLENAQGDVELREDSRVMAVAEENPDMKIIPLIVNFDVAKNRWMAAEVNVVLNVPKRRQKMIDDLLKTVREERYHGLVIDFEYIAPRTRRAYLQFLRELAMALHNEKKILAVCVEFNRPQAIDYKAVSRIADESILMAYDQHGETTEAGPICAIPWFTQILTERLREMDPAKTVLAIGNYGYDWAGNSRHPRSLGFNEALDLASESGAAVEFDHESLNPSFDYTDEKNVDHEVWFLDAITGFNEMQIARSRGIQTFALWRLGIEDNGYWNLDSDDRTLLAQNLSMISPGPRLEYEGAGEMIFVKSEADNGHRKLGFNAHFPLIEKSELLDFPNPYTLVRYGSVDKKVAITFDDGPDATYTPQILDILKHFGIHANFFDIGLNAEDERQLVKREFREGHEIGNHTFTHPNIAEIPKRQLEFELNSTQRLIESIIGRNCLLFRPPFNTDAEPATPNEAATISVVTNLGYITVGSGNDPEDYLQPGIDHIVNSTLAELQSGNIILLHDGGGKRDQTVAALPLLINQIRKRGYEIVPLSTLLGKTRDDVMPPLTPAQQCLRWANAVTFGAGQLFIHFSRWGLIIGITLGVIQFVIYSIMAFIQKMRKPPYIDQPYRQRVDVIVPAHNEEKVVSFTIQSLLQSQGVELRIIVVDDGSTDSTLRVLREEFGGHPLVRIITQSNSGKAAALNAGIRLSDAEVIVTLDSDTIFTRDCICELVRPFSDPSVTAVAGNAKVGNRINILTRWQALEYITTQNFIRRSNSLINCITVVPGAVGAWRREMLLRIGGYAGDTLAEDGELTIRVLKAGSKIVYADGAVAWTEAPQNLKSLFRQRFRWMYGTFQTAWKHRKLTFNAKYGALGWIAMPNTFVFQVFFPFTAPLMDLVMFLSLLFFFAQRAYHPTDFAVDELKHTVFFYSLFLLFDFATAVISILLEPGGEDWTLLVWLPWQRFFYRQLNHVIAIRTMFTAMKGKAVGWGHITRNASHLQYFTSSHLDELPPKEVEAILAKDESL